MRDKVIGGLGKSIGQGAQKLPVCVKKSQVKARPLETHKNETSRSAWPLPNLLSGLRGKSLGVWSKF